MPSAFICGLFSLFLVLLPDKAINRFTIILLAKINSEAHYNPLAVNFRQEALSRYVPALSKSFCSFFDFVRRAGCGKSGTFAS